eukprot:TRINITY_DN4192_c0_g2_i1.p1 TRINITY_DN4192_c0_g2~~TRINITY_DN4192_c0_g2_i1.p1  ORF type:complete len:152 (-),score=32.37 TRINITY_DN4192_c0_g2_i1:39-494(-)
MSRINENKKGGDERTNNENSTNKQEIRKRGGKDTPTKIDQREDSTNISNKKDDDVVVRKDIKTKSDPRLRQIGLAETLRDKQNSTVFKKLVFFSILMVTAPVILFFLTGRYLTQYVDVKAADVSLYAGVVSCVSVVLILVAYVIVAALEED